MISITSSIGSPVRAGCRPGGLPVGRAGCRPGRRGRVAGPFVETGGRPTSEEAATPPFWCPDRRPRATPPGPRPPWLPPARTRWPGRGLTPRASRSPGRRRSGARRPGPADRRGSRARRQPPTPQDGHRTCPLRPPPGGAAKDEAFSRRLAITWPSRSASASTHRGTSDPGATVSSRPSSRARGWNPSATCRTTVRQIHGPEVEGEAVGIQAGQVEEVLDQAFEPTGLGADDRGCGHRIIGGPVEDGIGVAADRGQRVCGAHGRPRGGIAVPGRGPGPGWRPSY